MDVESWVVGVGGQSRASRPVTPPRGGSDNPRDIGQRGATQPPPDGAAAHGTAGELGKPAVPFGTVARAAAAVSLFLSRRTTHLDSHANQPAPRVVRKRVKPHSTHPYVEAKSPAPGTRSPTLVLAARIALYRILRGRVPRALVCTRPGARVGRSGKGSALSPPLPRLMYSLPCTRWYWVSPATAGRPK